MRGSIPLELPRAFLVTLSVYVYFFLFPSPLLIPCAVFDSLASYFGGPFFLEMLSQKLTPLSFLVPNTLGRGVWRSLYFLLFFNLFHFGLFMKKATPLAPPSGKSARLGPCGPCGSLWSMRSMRFFFPCARMICRSVFARWYFPRAGSPTRPAPYRSKVRSFGVRWGWGWVLHPGGGKPGD